MEASLNLNNPLGYAEQVCLLSCVNACCFWHTINLWLHIAQVTLGAEYGSQSTNIYSLGMSKPRPGGTATLLDMRLHQLFHNYQPWSSYTELLRCGSGTVCGSVRRVE